MSLSSFSAFALTRAEMKNVIGSGSGASCHFKGGSEGMANYGNRTKKEAKKWAQSCVEGGSRG